MRGTEVPRGSFVLGVQLKAVDGEAILSLCVDSGLSDTSPDEGLIEDLTIEDKAVEQLAEGLLSHYLPDLQRSKQALQELTTAAVDCTCLKLKKAKLQIKED
ncbi:biogenesis of lysosome-related organelles complex 1 subunit 6 isoform X3 [Pan paniscus]|uniref:biogenesis of lysosome-related organelles complex 1 subunit 6 isoform X3 n=1 Tax=Pan paniscus TaxID=9597 RepID=UPI0007DBDCEB|nr:biogenesis of lysosome-related organelles complex 1 subunit 6 isoform X3 [Pan paniscus]